MNNYRYVIVIILIALTPCVYALSLVDPLSRYNNEGNELYSQGKYDEALQAYKNAQVENPKEANISYNIGNVFASQDKSDAAIKEYEKVIGNPDAQSLEARTYFNRGNAYYGIGLDAEQNQDIENAIKHLQASADSYLQSIRLNPNDEDAKFNYELAKKKLEMLQQQQQQEEEQQQQQNNEQEKNEQQEQKQDEDKEKQQEQDQQKQEEQEQDKQEQQEQKEQQEQQEKADKMNEQQQQPPQQQQPEERKMSKEDALRLLNAIEDQAQEQQLKELLKQQFKGSLDMERDW